MAKLNNYGRSPEFIFVDELNYVFKDCSVELNPKTKEVWVFGYPTRVFYNPDYPLETNVKDSIKDIHEFLIISV